MLYYSSCSIIFLYHFPNDRRMLYLTKDKMYGSIQNNYKSTECIALLIIVCDLIYVSCMRPSELRRCYSTIFRLPNSTTSVCRNHSSDESIMLYLIQYSSKHIQKQGVHCIDNNDMRFVINFDPTIRIVNMHIGCTSPAEQYNISVPLFTQEQNSLSSSRQSHDILMS